MLCRMIVEQLFFAPPGAAQRNAERLQLQAGAGIVGDRYHGARDEPGQNLTLVQAEALEAYAALQGRPVDWGVTRRNVIVRGGDLNALVGREFQLGAVRLRGVEPCHPCLGLGQALADDQRRPADVVAWWLHRGGLRCDVLNDAELALGDALNPG